MKYLSVDEVSRLCELGIEYWNLGDFAIRDYGMLESAVFSVAQEFGGVKVFNTLAEVAAAYWFKIVMNHPFEQGNKRAGFLAAEAFLFNNGHELLNGNSEVIDIGYRILKKEIVDPIQLAPLLKIEKLVKKD